MKKSVGVMAFVLFTAVLLGAGTLDAAPRATIASPGFDAGEIPQGQDILHDFIITNTGDETLTLKARPC